MDSLAPSHHAFDEGYVCRRRRTVMRYERYNPPLSVVDSWRRDRTTVTRTANQHAGEDAPAAPLRMASWCGCTDPDAMSSSPFES